MKTFSLITLALFTVFTGLANAKPATVKRDTPALASMPLELTIELVAQSYYPGDDELDGVNLEVMLKYRNTGSDTLILEKGSDEVSRIQVARSVDDLVAQHFEQNSTLTWVTGGEGSDNCFTGSQPTKCFVSLKPGEIYQVKGRFSLFAVRDDVRPITGGLFSGGHVVRIQVPTWSKARALAEQLRVRWTDYGVLWTGSVFSAPMPFTIPLRRSLGQSP